MLELKHLSVRLDGKQIVKELDLSLQPGKVQVLMGANGSGKSTLSLALAGHPSYLLSEETEILLDGSDLKQLSADKRAQAGLFLSFQNPVSIPGIPVKKMLKSMMDHLGAKRSTVDFLDELKRKAEFVGVKPELLERSLNQGFSGGEKKRIEMLTLMMAKPKYAILDEIDSGLDVDAIKQIVEAVKYAQKNFKTGFLVVSHYRRILDQLNPEQVYVLSAGRLVRSGGKELIDQVEAGGYGQL